jgi:hypothetical protein
MKIHKRRDYENNISWCGLKEDCDKVVMVSLWKHTTCKKCFETCIHLPTTSKDKGSNDNSKLSANRWYVFKKRDGELE